MKKIKFIMLGSVFIPTIFFVAAESGTRSKKTNPATNSFKKAPGSRITNGNEGVIFQAKNGDIYAMGDETGLEVLKVGYKNFVPAPGSITKDGQKGTIFQAKNGDIYVMGFGTGLEVLKDGEKEFKSAPGSKIKDGEDGTIFETKNGDIYVMGFGTGLEVLKDGKKEFKSAPESITKKGSGENGGGTIFETKNGDLYVMGYGTGLEVLKKDKDSFKSALDGSITDDGTYGTIFETKNGDLYVMGYGTGLEVLKDGKKEFKSAPGSKVEDGDSGTIFETKNGDLYVMGYGTGLEVLKKDADNFVPVSSSKITDGFGGTIFEAKNGDLYVMGHTTGLEVLKDGADKFVPVSSSKITDGFGGTIFEAKNGDLYVMGYTTGLEVLKDGADKFVPVSSSKITDGFGGTIFEAKNGDLYVMGHTTGLEVLKSLEFTKTDATPTGSDGSITIKDAGNYKNLQHKLLGSGSDWKNVKSDGRITALNTGAHQFQWIGKKNEKYLETINVETKIAKPKIGLHIETEYESAKGRNDGSIVITGTNSDDDTKSIIDVNSKLQYRLKDSDAIWKDILEDEDSYYDEDEGSWYIDDIVPGTYEFRWVGKKEQQYVGGTDTFTGELEVIIKPSDKIPAPGKTPTFTLTHPTAKDKNGFIKVVDGTDPYSKLQYKEKGASEDAWRDVPASGRIIVTPGETPGTYEIGVTPGTYQFQWVGKKGEQYAGGTSLFKTISKEATIDASNKIPAPGKTPTFTLTHPTAKGKNGFIKVVDGTDPYSKLQYKEKDASNWKDVPVGGRIGVTPGTYQFQWVGKKGEQYAGGTSLFKTISEEATIDASNKIPVPVKTPTFTLTNPAAKGKNGFIKVVDGTDPYSKLQYKEKDASNWKDVTTSGRIGVTPGTYQFQWVGKKGEQYAGGTSLFKTISEEATIDASNKIPAPGKTPTFTLTHPTAKGKNGFIKVVDGTDPYSKLQYKEKDTSNWKDVTTSGKIGVTPGTYQFQWVGKKGEQYEGGNSNVKAISRELTIDPLDKKLIIKKTSDNKTKLILAITIPVGFIFIIVMILLIKYKPFKKQKSKS